MLSPKKFSKGAVGLSIGILLVFLLSFNSYIRSGGQYLFGYFIKPFFYFGRSVFYNHDLEQLRKENEKLKNDSLKSLVDYTELKILRQENEVLRKELNYVKDNNLNYVVADILANSAVAELNILILNKGKKDNVLAGMGVISEDGVLIGKIFKVDDFTSQLMLINNNNISVSAKLLNDKGSTGIVSGNNNLTIRMGFIPLDDPIAVGDIVVTSGREKYIPAGITIGKLISVSRNDNDFFQTAGVESLINISNLKHVVILTSTNDNK